MLMRLLIALLELFNQLSAWDTANRLATKFPRLQDLLVNPSPGFDMPTLDRAEKSRLRILELRYR
jgi:hypothetical protein